MLHLRLARASPALVFLLPCLCPGQSADGNRAGSATNASRPQAVAQNTPKTPVLQVQSNLVLVDVVVTKNGVPVKGLSKDQFRVVENGKEQELKVFEGHTEAEQPATANTASTNVPAHKAPVLGPNTYSDFTPYPPSSSVNVLLLDALNTPSSDQAKVRKEMLAYLKKIPSGTRMAVLTLSSQLRMIQGFTADASVLAKAISEKGDIKQSAPEDTKSTDEQLLWMQNVEEIDGDGPSGNLAAAADAATLAGFRADLKSYSTDQQERMTLAAFKQIAHYLTAIPGRKNLIWFSGSFPLLVDPGGSLAAVRDYTSELRETDRLLAAARIAVYPVDAHGLLPRESATDASIDPSTVVGLAIPRMPSSAAARKMFAAQQQASQDTYLGDQTIQQIAAETGGKAFVNTNGFQEAIQQALADGANYYTIGYMPQGKDDGQFRRIKVNVNGGYQLAYRDGYYADSPESRRETQASTMKEAVEFGAPPPSEIPFKVRVISSTDPAAKGFTPAPGPAGANVKDLEPPVTRYLIDYMVDAHHFSFQKTPDGVAHTRLEFTVLAYDGDGKVLNRTDHGFEVDLAPAAYTQIMSGGFPQHQEIDLPAGHVFLRIVVHDVDGFRTGATEVPLTVAGR
jgi:VWFA-related protein